MEFTKISDTVVKTTETKVIEQQFTKNDLLDKIANIDSKIWWLNLQIAKLNEEKAWVESLIWELDKLGVITKEEYLLANPVIEEPVIETPVIELPPLDPKWTWDIIK